MNIHESAEDYLEKILMLQEKKGSVRSIDIAVAMGFSKPSVSVAMKNLRLNGLIEIDEARIDETCNAYFKWKDLNTYISNNSRRGINMPDAISEPMGCYCLGYLWNRGSEVGDATNPKTGEKIEFKATSRFEGDLSSFGPKCEFDDLVFLRFNLNEN